MSDFRPYMGKYILNDRREPVRATEQEWLRWWSAEPDRHIVAKTVVGGVEISTVFLHIDHGLQFDGRPPLIFETMLFDDYEEGRERRYRTWAEAEIGHMEAVEWLSSQQAATTVKGGSDV